MKKIPKIKKIIKNVNSIKQLLKIYALGKRLPLNVTHIITTRCNYRCKYCDMPSHTYNEMNTQQIFTIIDQMAKAGVRRYGISGGEPLLREDIGEVIDYAKSKGMIVTLFTNGFFVKQKIEQIKNIDVLLISLDGDHSVHDIHRHIGAYDKAIEAIQIANTYKIPVWIGFTLTKYSVNKIDFILEKSKELGFKILVQPVFNYPGYSADEKTIKEMQEFGDDFRKAINMLIQKKEEGYSIITSTTYLKNMISPYDKKVPHWNRNTCWAIKAFCALTPDGLIAPCFKTYNIKNWPDATKLGFLKALELIPEFTCEGCYSYATTEFNYLYSLNPEVIYNTFINLLSNIEK